MSPAELVKIKLKMTSISPYYHRSRLICQGLIGRQLSRLNLQPGDAAKKEMMTDHCCPLNQVRRPDRDRHAIESRPALAHAAIYC